MKKLIYLVTILTCISCNQNSKNTGEKNNEKHQKEYWRHLSYLVEIKSDVAKKEYSEFSETDFYQPLTYYTFDGTFVVNPNKHIQKLTKSKNIRSFKGYDVIKLPDSYTDTTNFNFSTNYVEHDTTALYYKENVLYFQSFNLTKKLIGVEDIQDWSIMVIHELFHGFQRQIPKFKSYYTQLKIPGGPDRFLGKYHKELEWYQKSIYKENELLKSIWIENADLMKTLESYDSLRTLRIDRIKNEYGIDIREVEDYEILMEGHTRYFESLCKRYLSKNNPDTSMLTDQDKSSISSLFNEYNIKKDKSLYNIYNDRYYYQLGYNISIILEKYLPEYRETLYVKEYNFNSYLETLKELK